MTLFSSILGYSAFGLGTRCLQLGIMRKPVFSGLHGHAISIIAFGLVGAGAYHVEIRQAELLAQKKEAMLANRQRETKEWEAQKSQAHAV